MKNGSYFPNRDTLMLTLTFLTIPWFTKSVTPWWVLVHETWCIFWQYLLNHNSLSHQTWPIDRYKNRQYFSEILWAIWNTRAKFQALFNVATCSNYAITNYVKFPVFHFFWKGEWGRIKGAKYQVPKIDRSRWIVISLKS